MEAQIETRVLIEDIRDAFIAELTPIPEDTYTKTGAPIGEREFERALVFADTTVRSTLERFLLPDMQRVVSSSGMLPDTLIYIITGAARRLAGKANYMADMIQDALKEAALSKLFTTIDGDISGKHTQAAADILTQLSTSLFTKLPPRRSIR